MSPPMPHSLIINLHTKKQYLIGKGSDSSFGKQESTAMYRGKGIKDSSSSSGRSNDSSSSFRAVKTMILARLVAKATIVAHSLVVKAAAMTRALLEKYRRMIPACSSTTKKNARRGSVKRALLTVSFRVAKRLSRPPTS